MEDAASNDYTQYMTFIISYVLGLVLYNVNRLAKQTPPTPLIPYVICHIIPPSPSTHATYSPSTAPTPHPSS